MTDERKYILIGLAGFTSSGKDTAAEYLDDTHEITPRSFAHTLKKMVQLALPFTDKQLFGPSAAREEMLEEREYLFSGTCVSCGKECDFLDEADLLKVWYCVPCNINYPKYLNARIACQTLGTEWGRRLNKDFWVTASLHRTSEDHCVYTDTRFMNEWEAIRNKGGFLIRIHRGRQSYAHESERALANTPETFFDYVIDNQYSFGNLQLRLDVIMADIHRKLWGEEAYLDAWVCNLQRYRATAVHSYGEKDPRTKFFTRAVQGLRAKLTTLNKENETDA